MQAVYAFLLGHSLISKFYLITAKSERPPSLNPSPCT